MPWEPLYVAYEMPDGARISSPVPHRGGLDCSSKRLNTTAGRIGAVSTCMIVRLECVFVCAMTQRDGLKQSVISG